MKKFLLLATIAFMLLIVACNPKAESTNKIPASERATVYACPMHAEVTSDKPGQCQKCGMDLKLMDPNSASKQFEMQFSVSPTSPEARKTTQLRFTPKIKGNEQAQVPLDEVHTEKIHVIIASKDLGWYDHIHPKFQADGSYIIDEIFPTGGEYVIFADYHPSGAGNQVQRLTVNIDGTPKKAESFTTQSLTHQTDVYLVKLEPVGGKLLTNNTNHVGVTVTENGKPVTAFENIMGAKGHLVIISGDSQKYLHVHPDEVEGKLDLHTEFEQPGIYRAFFQFQTNGKLQTSYFTLDVKEGKPGELEGGEHGHSH